MKLAILHYHLNRGGVTQVIANHLRALDGLVAGDGSMPVAVIYGGRCEGWPEDLPRELKHLDVSLRTVPELDYDSDRPPAVDLDKQLVSVLDAGGFRPQETILHVHNHALGKNIALPGALGELARAGYALLLHIHDFAEDFRLDNYARLAAASTHRVAELHTLLYPQAPQIHYAVLNSRDHTILLDAGVCPSRLHMLPNTVVDFGALPSRDQSRRRLADRFGVPVDRRLVLYPVRGIRRKNLGEALLWSAVASADTWVGLTLPPLNPLEQPKYQSWKNLAAALQLPCVFELGGTAGLDYLENLAASDLVLTTSVAEGFGLVFLEAWLAGRPLVGRDLPEITADFLAAGMRFDGLRPHLLVPVEWIGEGAFRAAIEADFARVLAAYQQSQRSGADLRGAIDALIDDGLVDFAACQSSMQRQIVERVASDETSRKRVRAANPWMGPAIELDQTNRETIKHNAEIVRTTYSLRGCGRRLLDIYERAALSHRSDLLEPLPCGERILKGFLSLPRFHPLRIEI